jgi:hypothetical protein
MEKKDFPNQLLEVFNRIRSKERKLKIVNIFNDPFYDSDNVGSKIPYKMALRKKKLKRIFKL